MLDFKEIKSIGFVVRDVDEKVRLFWEKLCIGPWTFIEFGPNIEKSTYYGEPCSFFLKIAETQVGPITLELTQPVSGPSPHMDFLKTKGEGMQNLSFMIDSPEEVEKMKNFGYKEISNASGIGEIKDSYDAYFDTDKDLATTIELSCYPTDGSDIEVYKLYPDPEDDLPTNDQEVIVKKIAQIAIVVKDLDKTVEYYWNKLGIGPWCFSELGPGLDKECYGEPCEFSFKIASAKIGSLMLELIQPVSGETPQMKFLKARGEGLYSLGIFIDDIAQLEDMKKLGYKQIVSIFGIGGKDGFAVYFDTEKDIGAVIGLMHIDGLPDYYKFYPEPG